MSKKSQGLDISDTLNNRDTLDSYRNELTGIGDWLKDKTYGGNINGVDFELRHIKARGAENRWRGSDLGGRVVETVPDEMTREGWEISIQPGDDEEDEAEEKLDAFGDVPMPMPEPSPKPLPEIDDSGNEMVEEIEAKLEELNFADAIWEALCFERAYGGGAILIGANDGTKDLAQPLNEENIASIDWINVFQGGLEGELQAQTYYRDPRSAKYGLPEVYQLRNIGVPVGASSYPGQPAMAMGKEIPNAQISYVHESRLLVFPGTPVSRRARVEQRGWGDSIFTRIDDVLSQFGQTWGGIANLMQDFSQGVLKIDGLAAALAGGNKASRGAPLSTRAQQLNMARSISRLMLIDKEEEFTRETASLAGIADILQQFAIRLAAAADMPVTLLMGQSPSGLNATGASDVRFFYDRIAAKQKKRLLPQLKRFIRLLMLSKEGPTEGVEPERWDVKFRPLYQLTELETAQLRYQVAQTDQIYINSGVLSAEEVAASAFGTSEWSQERMLDLEGRQKMLEDDQKKQEEKQAVMSEAAKAGLDPSQMALNHPEHPANAPLPKQPEEKK